MSVCFLEKAASLKGMSSSMSSKPLLLRAGAAGRDWRGWSMSWGAGRGAGLGARTAGGWSSGGIIAAVVMWPAAAAHAARHRWHPCSTATQQLQLGGDDVRVGLRLACPHGAVFQRPSSVEGGLCDVFTGNFGQAVVKVTGALQCLPLSPSRVWWRVEVAMLTLIRPAGGQVTFGVKPAVADEDDFVDGCHGGLCPRCSKGGQIACRAPVRRGLRWRSLYRLWVAAPSPSPVPARPPPLQPQAVKQTLQPLAFDDLSAHGPATKPDTIASVLPTKQDCRTAPGGHRGHRGARHQTGLAGFRMLKLTKQDSSTPAATGSHRCRPPRTARPAPAAATARRAAARPQQPRRSSANNLPISTNRPARRAGTPAGGWPGQRTGLRQHGGHAIPCPTAPHAANTPGFSRHRAGCHSTSRS